MKQTYKSLICFRYLLKKMSQLEPIKNILESLKTEKCTRKDCSSDKRGNIEVVWFGKQYDTKEMSCSCCYMLDDQAIKKSIPATYNVLPLLKFNEKLLEEYKAYEQRKKSQNWHPLVMKQKKTEIITQLNNFEAQVIASLTGLQTALQNFLKALQIKHKQIFYHQTMNEIIEMKGKNEFERLLDSINQLVKQLNYSEITKNYEFERIDIRNKKIQKERAKVTEVIQKVNKVLTGLLEDIKKRNEMIAKI